MSSYYSQPQPIEDDDLSMLRVVRMVPAPPDDDFDALAPGVVVKPEQVSVSVREATLDDLEPM